jgi:hypothetical protein
MLLILYMWVLLPSGIAHAATAPTDLKSLLDLLSGIIEMLVVFTFVLTFLTIMWGTIKAWVFGGGSSESIEAGKKVVLTGVLGLVVMSSIWGILSLLKVSLFGTT